MTFGRSTSASAGSSPELGAARVLACTATATPIVRDEILARLGLPADTPQIVRGFARPNLALRAVEVTGARERERLVDAALAEALGGARPARVERPSSTPPRASKPRRRRSASPAAGGVRGPITPGSTGGRASARRPTSPKAGPRSWSRPTPSAWASTGPTSAR